MSKILNRPMFRGGGKVSSYGNGIATGLADGGRVNLKLGGDTMFNAIEQANKFKGYGPQLPRGLSGMLYRSPVKTLAGGVGLGAGVGTGIGLLTDAIVKAGDTPEAYAYRKQAQKDNPYMNMETDVIINEDGTMTSQGEIVQDRINELDVGEKYGFFPRGGAEKRLEELGLTGKFDLDGNKIVVEEEVEGDGKTDVERRLEMEKNALKELLESFGSGSKKEDTEDEALAAIEKKQKLLEKVMGGGKSAKIADASDMALTYAAGALKEGATVKSSFADFFDKESSRPSRSQKVKDAAANAAIQAYLTEKISEKDFSKQMALITGQAQIKQKFANAAKANLSVQDYVTGRGASVSKSEAIENGARGVVENNDKYKSFTPIDSKDNIPGLLIEANLGEVFMDKKTKEVFAVIILEDGTVGKEILYN